jgi:hypothetical protein
LEQDCPVFLPIGHSPDIDLITVIDNRVMRVQVKTSTQFHGNRWEVAVCTRGGNRSWNGLVKYLDPSHTTAYLSWSGMGDGGSSRLLKSAGHVEFGSAGRSTNGSRSSPEKPSDHPFLARLSDPWRDSRAVKGDAL